MALSPLLRSAMASKSWALPWLRCRSAWERRLLCPPSLKWCRAFPPPLLSWCVAFRPFFSTWRLCSSFSFVFLLVQTKQDGDEGKSESMHDQRLEENRGSPFAHLFMVKLFDEWKNLTDGCSVSPSLFPASAFLPCFIWFSQPVVAALHHSQLSRSPCRPRRAMCLSSHKHMKCPVVSLFLIFFFCVFQPIGKNASFA